METKLQKANNTLRHVFNQLPNYDLVVPALLEYGIDELPKKCFLSPGVPLRPMLAQPTKGVSEVLDRFSGLTFTCEFKYDGFRAQVHICKTFSF